MEPIFIGKIINIINNKREKNEENWLGAGGGNHTESQCAVSKAEFGSIERQGEYKRIFSQTLDRGSKSDFFFFNMFIFK